MKQLELIKKLTVNSTDSILSVLKKMDEVGKKMLFVYDENKFLGIISLGDIQRAIIKNITLDTKIKEILRDQLLLAYDNEELSIIKERMLRNRTECMPVVNDKNELITVYFWEDFFNKKRKTTSINKPVVIMAGGVGSRLKPITNILPKPLIPLDDKTILEHIMDKFTEIDCHNFYISVNYKAEMIKQYFNSINNPEYNISYFQEEKPLGTAGSLFLLKDKINETFFVSNCDILIEEDFSEIYDYHISQKNELTVVAALKHYNIPYGTVETGKGGELLSFKEKPELTFKINSGLYILEKNLLNEIPENTFFHITDLIDQILKRNGKVGVFPVSEGSWKDIGEWDEYLKNYKREL
jgi:dTDP-glucose pyrophosphorylase